jgi:hypothetical protein
MVVQHGKEATNTERSRYKSGANDWYEYCLNNVRTALDIGSKYDWAIHAWEGAQHRHVYHAGHHIPFGAPVFSKGSSAYGHIFLAGGRFKNGARIFWTNDQHGDGRITPVELSFFSLHWGHKVLGWTEDLNGVDIPYLR